MKKVISSLAAIAALTSSLNADTMRLVGGGVNFEGYGSALVSIDYVDIKINPKPFSTIVNPIVGYRHIDSYNAIYGGIEVAEDITSNLTIDSSLSYGGTEISGIYQFAVEYKVMPPMTIRANYSYNMIKDNDENIHHINEVGLFLVLNY